MFLLTAALLVLPVLTFQQIQNIEGCVCFSPCGAIKCRRGTVNALPTITTNTTEVDMSGNRFSNPMLERINFTGYTHVETLTLNNCGINSINYNTFVEMTKLRSLDLSGNNLAIIAAGALEGLSLKYLFLNQNPKIQLIPKVFEGMTTEVLGLSQCNIERLSASIFQPIKSKLRTLLLQGNKIERFDRSMLDIFRDLNIVRFHDNPLICDCESRWLKEIYDLNEGTSFEPRCASPKIVSGFFFDALTVEDFSCDTPTLQANISFTKHKGTLACVSRGNPLPTVSWYKPNGVVVESTPQGNKDSNRNEIELVAGERNASGQYRCIASNDGGNISLSVNVDWPFPSSTNVIDGSDKPVDCNPTAEPKDVMLTNSPSDSDSDSQAHYLQVKYFTLVDMVAAILGTFVSTLVITVVTLHFCVYRRKKAPQYTTPAMSEYSSSSNGSDKTGPYPISLHSLQASQVQAQAQRPLPSKPYHKIYDENHYMATNIEERDEFLRLSAHQAANGRITSASSSCDTCPACRTMPHSHIS